MSKQPPIEARPFSEIVSEAQGRIEGVLSSSPEPEDFRQQIEALAIVERRNLAGRGLSKTALQHELAWFRAALQCLSASRERMQALAIIYADVFSEVARRIENNQRLGGRATASVNKVNGRTFGEIKEDLRAIWLSGKYPSKNKCAEAEFERLGIALKTARNALIGVPDPPPR